MVSVPATTRIRPFSSSRRADLSSGGFWGSVKASKIFCRCCFSSPPASLPTWLDRVTRSCISSTIDFDDLNFDQNEYTPIGAYNQSKLANILFANELDRRYRSQNLRALSLHPGGILTPLTRYLPSVDNIKADKVMYATMKSEPQGAATMVLSAVAKEWEGKGDVYLDEVAEGWLAPPDALYYHGGYAPQAFDSPTEKRLWDVSMKLVGLGE